MSIVIAQQQESSATKEAQQLSIASTEELIAFCLNVKRSKRSGSQGVR